VQQPRSKVLYHALDSQDPFVLWRVQPGFIILYDPDMAFMRQVEVYQVRGGGAGDAHPPTHQPTASTNLTLCCLQYWL
jgi:hypothetical protein